MLLLSACGGPEPTEEEVLARGEEVFNQLFEIMPLVLYCDEARVILDELTADLPDEEITDRREAIKQLDQLEKEVQEAKSAIEKACSNRPSRP